MCVTLPPTMLLSYPCFCLRIFSLDKVHQLVYIPSLTAFPGKMLQRYSVRLRIYSWFMKYCHPKLASAGVIAGDVGRRQQSSKVEFLLPSMSVVRERAQQTNLGMCKGRIRLMRSSQGAIGTPAGARKDKQ